jgi:hypothetical protein
MAKGGELFLVNAYIPEYLMANRFNHEPRRTRKLLVHRTQARRLAAAIQREGMTLIPLKALFQPEGYRQGRAWHRQGQETPRQARDLEAARLGPRQSSPAALEGLVMTGDDEGRIKDKLIRVKQEWAKDGRLLTGRPDVGHVNRLPPGQREVKNWPVLDLGDATKTFSRARGA